MNLRVFFNLLVLGSLLALAGCASSPRSGQGAETEDATVGGAAVPDPNKPHLFFSGGDVQQVRGAALGAAVTQGWKVEDTAGESLILQRNLDSAAAEALAPGASRGPLPPIVEVRADFFTRPGGVETQLGAQVITQRGTPKETRQDYTDAYRNELSHSLATLQNAWHEAGPRIAKALPPTGGFQDSNNTEGQVADTPALSTFDSGYADNSATVRNDPVPLASSPVAAEFETQTGAEEEPQASSAATWALPAGAAATAAAAAQARASALPPAQAQATTVKAGPAPVVSLAPAANPRLSQRPAPAPLPRTASAAPQQVAAKGASGISSAKAGKAEVTSPVKAIPTTTGTKMASGSTATVATAAKPASRTTTPAANKKAASAASKTTAPTSVAQTKVPVTKTASATGTKSAKPGATPASTSTAGQAPGKTTPAKQQPAKPTTTGSKTVSASGTTAAGTNNSTKPAANAPKTNSTNKTTGTTAGAKKTTSSKEN